MNNLNRAMDKKILFTNRLFLQARSASRRDALALRAGQCTLIKACGAIPANKTQGEYQMPSDEERIKSLSDVELELEVIHLSPSYCRNGHPALKELLARREQKERNNKDTQQKIKYMTAVILALTLAGVILSCILLFK